MRFLHLFSGPQRDTDIGNALRAAAASHGWNVEGVNFDVCIATEADLLQDDIYRKLLDAAASGAFDIIVSGIPCSTWSSARHRVLSAVW